MKILTSIEGFENVDLWVQIALLIVGGLIVLVAIGSLGVSIYLAIKYITYNRRKNSIGMTGQDAARKILDANGLNHIKVSCVGSLMFGNSYSHYFKKVRLRRLTYKKQSISSLAMAAQKSCLAILDKEGDPDMKRRVRLVPLITFGPFAFIPLLIIGILLDFIVFGGTGVITLIFAILGFSFYIFAFVLTVMTLKTEMKAQKRAYEVLKENAMATDEELEMMKELFRLYNIQYINDMIMAFLEILYRVLMIIARVQSSSTSSSSN